MVCPEKDHLRLVDHNTWSHRKGRDLCKRQHLTSNTGSEEKDDSGLGQTGKVVRKRWACIDSEGELVGGPSGEDKWMEAQRQDSVKMLRGTGLRSAGCSATHWARGYETPHSSHFNPHWGECPGRMSSCALEKHMGAFCLRAQNLESGGQGSNTNSPLSKSVAVNKSLKPKMRTHALSYLIGSISWENELGMGEGGHEGSPETGQREPHSCPEAHMPPNG